MLDGVANSVNPDQTALGESDLCLHCLHTYSFLSEKLVYEILGQLLYPTSL